MCVLVLVHTHTTHSTRTHITVHAANADRVRDYGPNHLGLRVIAQAEAARLRILHAQKVADRKAARDAELAERCVVQNFQFGTPAAVAVR